ncbi:hypothetical protein BOX15_Mlig017679g2 [Macrostomum lignano]|uniref:Uncharacterized protein n=1 Tax=Macrostomum lignano TaxID=282301 RepID=A0A267GME0_9PLAT|nr:hypothetical protein BOX15_Mlig017679g2 [Macrostomum lignano]
MLVVNLMRSVLSRAASSSSSSAASNATRTLPRRNGPAANNFHTVEPQLCDAVIPKKDLVDSGFRYLPRIFYAQVNMDWMLRRQQTIKYAGDRYGKRPKRMSMIKRYNKLSYEALMKTPKGIWRMHRRLIDNRDRLWPYQ